MSHTVASPKRSLRTVLARLGLAGFAFFLVKGLLWLVTLGWGFHALRGG
jgi:hypothetical protein